MTRSASRRTIPEPRTDNDLAAMFALASRAGLDTPNWNGTLGVRS
ncbi:hypothetical protein [Nocardia anaemiae]|nr:hypothetical protein [Nocardia anaemiae]